MIYRFAPAKRPDGRKGFARSDYRDLPIAAHHQLGGPIVVIWDDLNTHVCASMKKFMADHAWLTVFQLPAYALELNPTEGIWTLLRRALANIAFADLTHLEHAARQRLRVIQRQPGLIDGCVAGTGLVLNI